MRFPRSIAAPALAGLLVAVVGGITWSTLRSAPALSPELATPRLALAHLSAGQAPNESNEPRSLFFTPPALPFVKAHPDWIGGDPAKAEALAKEYNLVAHNPKAWRTLDRQSRFDTVLLMDDPAAFRPLLDHLSGSTDWTLTYLDATSIIFRRSPAKAWSAADLTPLKETFATHPKREQILLRVQTAHRLIALNEMNLAKTLLDEASAIDPDSAVAWSQLSFWHATQGQWNGAVAAAERAYKADPQHLPAVTAQANALFAQGKFNEALKLTRQLVKELPEDGPALYLHAKVTHAAHAYTQEIEVLKKIIDLAAPRSLPTGTWRVFLGQAYAATGEADAALKEFELALKDPTLTTRERSFSEKALNRLQDKEPLGNL